MLEKTKKSYAIQAVENALTVLEALGEIDGDVRLTRLSETVGMNKTYVFRLLATFEKRGFVEKEERAGKYRLGASAYEMGQKFLSRLGLLRTARPIMQGLVREFNEAVYLAIPCNRQMLMLDMVDTNQMVGTIPLVGNRYPLINNAVGKVLLAFGHEPRGGVGEVSSSLLQEMEVIRQQGAALDAGGMGEGVAALAVPLLGEGGRICGSLCMVGPDFRIRKERLAGELLPGLKAAGQTISAKMGFINYHPYS